MPFPIPKLSPVIPSKANPSYLTVPRSHYQLLHLFIGLLIAAVAFLLFMLHKLRALRQEIRAEWGLRPSDHLPWFL